MKLFRYFKLPLIAVAYLALATVCLIAVVYGGIANPQADPRADALDLCDGGVCFMGQIPGESLWQVAHQYFSDSNQLQQANRNRIALQPYHDTYTSLTPSTNQKTIGQIEMRFGNDAQFPVGWVLERFGTPCGISWSRSFYIVSLHYPDLSAHVMVKNKRFDPYASLSSVFLYDPDDEGYATESICADEAGPYDETLEWQGFAPGWFYQDQGRF